jgi:ATP-dependent DNA helicase PIF1
MSFFQRRKRNSNSNTSNSNNSNNSNNNNNNSNSNAGCFAVVNDQNGAGIYFTSEEAKRQVINNRSSSTSSSSSSSSNNGNSNNDCDFQGFNKVKDAEFFLRERGYVPVKSGGWIDAKGKNPIIYTRSNSRTTKQATPTPNAMSYPERKVSSSSQGSMIPGSNNNIGGTVVVDRNKKQIQHLWSNHQHGATAQQQHQPQQQHQQQQNQYHRQQQQNQNQQRQNLYPQPIISIDSDSDSSPESKQQKKQQQEPNRKRTELQSVQKLGKKQKRLDNTDDKNNNNNSNNKNDDDDDDDGADVGRRGNKKKTTASLPSLQPPPPQEFDVIQQRAINAALNGNNVFITGVAGTGKSLVTKKIVEDAKRFKKEVAVAAPTGVAAVNLGPELGAQTIHSLAGVGVPQTASDFKKLLSPWAIKKWKKIDILVLDEIGMLSADFLDWLDVFVRKARKNQLQAFGGIQIVFVGDFAQLGPIPGKGNSLKRKAYEPDQPGADCLMSISECAGYAFQTVLWREADFHHVHLRKVYRQKNQDFQLALMDIREAKATSVRVKNLVDTCSTPLDDRPELDIPDGIKPTILYCTNRNVDRENYENLTELPDQGKNFDAIDSTSVSGEVNTGGQDAVEKLLTRNSFFKDCSASKRIHLKKGAQVMLLQNLDIKNGLVNGSRGVIECFKLCPVIKGIINGEEQLIGPNDMDKFPGMRFEDLKFNQKTEYEGSVWRISRFLRFPFVRFVNNVSRIIVPESFERTLYRQGKCVRLQIPLRLAWALTIHKSQGATLDFVVCDLQGCFTSGQAYVALSRARSMRGLQIKNFSSRHVTADPLVEAFYDALDRNDMRNFLEDQAGE